jgi:hypothetical protein
VDERTEHLFEMADLLRDTPSCDETSARCAYARS